MQTNPILLSLFVLLSLSGSGYGQTKKSAVNFLGIQGPITIQKNAYQLSWSAHPDASLYKQEYLAAGDNFPKYRSMVTVDFVVTDSGVKQAVSTRIRELEVLKKTNPIVNYELMENKATGEFLLDCVLGQTAADERDSIVERDVYRYKAAKAKSGQPGILLLMVSVRQYGNAITPFLKGLKANKSLLVNEMAKLSMPLITIAQ